jgi:hypothetical protein
MFTEKQVKTLIAKQKYFLNFPGVRKPFVVLRKCCDCGQKMYQLKCCKSIWCPICNLQQSLKIAKEFRFFQKKFQNKKIAFLTLTYKNIKSINETTFQNYRNCFTKKFIRYKEIKQKIIGGLYAFDYTISKYNTYNFHLHCLVFLNDYINQKVLSKYWKKATGNSFVVDIREVKNIKSGIQECLKYLNSNKLLAENLNDLKVKELIKSVQKIKRFSKFGCCYGVKIPKNVIKCNNCNSENYRVYNTITYAYLDYDVSDCSEKVPGVYTTEEQYLSDFVSYKIFGGYPVMSVL